ncbi:basic leucine zipper transcriptional factor ATF-like 3 isoform X3 [Cavia porcellus]|uniref:basic leucine zipper transcriptional factor ATF-like 3 isoform X3 n=1 Tax=Cavia porcellus TaxID=10141 RepID=UPI002FE2B064
MPNGAPNWGCSTRAPRARPRAPRRLRGWASRSRRVSEPPRDFHEAQGSSGKATGSPEDDDRKVRRREKNRVAAQRSRKKQTQKADKLHEEYECLEQENALLRREIAKLNEELQQLSLALKEHEKMCPLLLCPMNFVPGLRPDPVASCLPR